MEHKAKTKNVRRRTRTGGDDDVHHNRRRTFSSTSSKDHHHLDSNSSSQSSIKTCCQFLFMSSIIPLLFFLRMARHDENSILWRSRNRLTIPDSSFFMKHDVVDPTVFQFLPDLLTNYALQKSSSLSSRDYEWFDSDIVELHHCKSLFIGQSMNWTSFTTWASHWHNKTIQQLSIPGDSAVENEYEEYSNNNKIHQEIILELLELYAAQKGYCKFQNYRSSASSLLQHHDGDLFLHTISHQPIPKYMTRIAFVISIRQQIDHPDHIKRLLEAIYMSHHYIVLHIGEEYDEHSSNGNNQFKIAIEKIIQDYDNVILVQFGTLFPSRHRSSSSTTTMNGMSMIHLKIMRWLTMDLRLKYDYHVTLDGSSFPLLSPEGLSQHLYKSTDSVWLGTLTEQGKVVSESQTERFMNKRMSVSSIPKTSCIGAIFSPNVSDIPDFLLPTSNDDANNDILLNDKTMSGNYAVFSFRTIHRILTSPQAKQLFAMSKYACCSTCMDNYIWSAVMRLLDYEGDRQKTLHEQSKTNTAMFQLWSTTASEDGKTCGGGGEDYRIGSNDNNKNVGGSINVDDDIAAPAVLSMDPSRCYRIEHPHLVKAVHNESYTIPFKDLGGSRERLFLRGGGEVLKHLHQAKEIGFLFAGPFDSTEPQSTALLDELKKLQ